MNKYFRRQILYGYVRCNFYVDFKLEVWLKENLLDPPSSFSN